MIPADPGGATGIIEVTIDLGGGATTWSIGRAGGARSTFIKSFTPKSGDRTNNILTIVYNRNTGVQRLADFAISTNGTPSAAKGLRLIQLAAPPTVTGVTTTNTVASNTVDYFHFTEKLPVDATGTITATISLGSTATGWTAAKDGDVGNTFITSFTGSGSGSTSMVISYSANTGGTERSATINITPTGASSTTGAVFALALTQLGTPSTITGITATNTVGSGSPVSFDPSAQDLAADATGTLSVTIALGGAATGWTAAKVGDRSNEFITDFTASGGSSTLLEIAYSSNTGVTERSVTINLTPTDALGDTGPIFPFTITQLFGGDHTLSSSSVFAPVLVGSNLTAEGGTISTTFTLGRGATGWEATETLDYVELTPSSGDGSTPVVVTYEANGTFDTRDVEITVKTTGATGVSITEDFTFTQEGSQGLTVVTRPADVEDLSTDAGSIAVDVSLFGSAKGWDAALTTNPGTFLSLSETDGAAGTDVLTISYTENTDVALREGVVTLTATGGRGTAQDTVLTISQLGTGPNVVVRAPTGEDFLALPAAAGTIVAEVSLTGGASDWTAVAEASNPANFLTVGAKDGASDPKTQTIAYAENTGVSRTGTVTFTTSGGTGAAAVRAIDFRQLGAAPTIDVSTGASDITMIPASPTGGGTTATITATITLGGGAEGWTATKSDDDSDAFISDFTSSGDRANLTLTITYNFENTGFGSSWVQGPRLI